MTKLSRHCDKALALKPDLAEAWLGRGNVFSDLRSWAAFAAYDKALTLNPDLAEAWLGRGNVFNELNRYEEAFAAYDKALDGAYAAHGWGARRSHHRQPERSDGSVPHPS